MKIIGIISGLATYAIPFALWVLTIALMVRG